MKKILFLIVLIPAVIFLYLILHGPTDSQINLKTGDIRRRLFSVPIQYSPLSQPYSGWLGEISAGDDRWVTVAKYPLPTSNNSDLMCQNFYEETAIWVTVNPKIAKAALDDVKSYIISTGAKYSLPDAVLVLHQVQWNEHQKPEINHDWRLDPSVRTYLKERNLENEAN